MSGRTFVTLAIAAGLTVLPACGGVVSPSQNRIEDFQGVVSPGGVGPQHEFSASRNGEFEIRFLGFEPAGAILEVVFGQPVGPDCQAIRFSLGGQNSILLAGAISPGPYCVVVFDDGLIAQNVAYTIRVSYP